LYENLATVHIPFFFFFSYIGSVTFARRPTLAIGTQIDVVSMTDPCGKDTANIQARPPAEGFQVYQVSYFYESYYHNRKLQPDDDEARIIDLRFSILQYCGK
jgi:hypothetical protein